MSFINSQIQNNNIHRFSHNAMATVFEIVIELENKSYAEQAASAAFLEIDSLEEDLSRFKPNSDISRINNLGVGKSIKLGLNTFECLSIAKNIFEMTNKLFDVTSGKIIDKWKNIESNNISVEDSNKIKSGMDKVILDPNTYSIELHDENIKFDLGGLGKGFAIDIICDQLIEWDIQNALIHSGGSTVKTIGKFNNFDGWPITISNPINQDQTIAEIILKNNSLSGSGKQKLNHIINPINNLPVTQNIGCWALAKSAAVSDALSTAFMLMSAEQVLELCSNNNEISGMIILKESDNLKLEDFFKTNNFSTNKFFI
ncbi:MAG: FAD:protein FMN transferase [Ignavibacteriae bacterium]|nr:FAD:protein FMN transferase [Ignavibacteriota bacterium]MCB9208808.1 FAD:protein FMN transferase [Ignavibacteriales bacterium]MCB9218274.1 FAD:protein FMN transferase [Ignavibacteriales bacterium]MCB9260569.1 FAD:protein FMN transferase [Ignavibacteriales bacterium]